jgi:hypothetical protein
MLALMAGVEEAAAAARLAGGEDTYDTERGDKS